MQSGFFICLRPNIRFIIKAKWFRA